MVEDTQRHSKRTMPTTRTPFIASTPDRTTFDTDVPLSSGVSFIPAPTASRGSGSSRLTRTWRRWTGRLGGVVESNIGLLLVASSQLFFSLMNVGVKTLNSLDPPVPAMEVSSA